MKTLLFLIALSLSVSAQRPGRRGGDSAPKPGEAIPEVSVVTLKDKKKVDLSKPEKVTVLIFGSHT